MMIPPLAISTKVSYAKGKGLLGYFAWHIGVDYNWLLSQIGNSTYTYIYLFIYFEKKIILIILIDNTLIET